MTARHSLSDKFSSSTKENLQARVDAETGACAAKLEIARRAKELGYDDSAFDRIMSEKSRVIPDGQHSEFKAYYNIYKSRSKKNVKNLLKKQVSSIRKNYTPYGINTKSR